MKSIMCLFLPTNGRMGIGVEHLQEQNTSWNRKPRSRSLYYRRNSATAADQIHNLKDRPSTT